MSDLVNLRQLVEARPVLTERWVRSMCGRKDPNEQFPHYKPGGRLVFDLDEVDTFLRRRPAGSRTATEAEGVLRSTAPADEREEGSPAATGEPSQ